MQKLAIVCVATAIAACVQGASLTERTSCSATANTGIICETTAGSPLAADCQEAVRWLQSHRPTTQCNQGNGGGSFCASIVSVGTCKIDICGPFEQRLRDGVSCSGYLQALLDGCPPWQGHVGGQIHPADCAMESGRNKGYRLQFSHS